jgi:hypothetical protein
MLGPESVVGEKYSSVHQLIASSMLPKEVIMSEQPFSDEVAFRIALAARALPGVSVSDLIEGLQTYLGDVLDEAALSKITVTNLKTAIGQTYRLDAGEDGEDARFPLASLKEAVKILWGETTELSDGLPPIAPYQDGDMPDSIRIAIASNTQEQLDGHFGSCLRYLIYQLSSSEIRLIDIRSAAGADRSGDKNAYRVGLISDCHVLYNVTDIRKGKRV